MLHALSPRVLAVAEGAGSNVLRATWKRRVFWGRFVGFIRPVVPLAAGIARMPYRSFVLVDSSSAAPWGTGTVLIGFFIGTGAHTLMRSTGVIAVLPAAAVIAGGFLLHKTGVASRTKGVTQRSTTWAA